MNTTFFFVAALSAAGLLGLLFWALRGASRRKSDEQGMSALESAPCHLRNMAQIRQSMDAADLEFAKAKAGNDLAARLHRERRRITLLYLSAIRNDFEQSLRVARIIAVLSPEISGSHEYERLRLSILFRSRFQMVRLRLLIGIIPQPQIFALGEMTASLAMQLEEAMAQLGERAALAAELALQSEK
ncbi:MAG TPA: hypothetical protein VIW23_06025 [Candidatus Acidoferrum sp.]|jgi:hypothetical protein